MFLNTLTLRTRSGCHADSTTNGTSCLTRMCRRRIWILIGTICFTARRKVALSGESYCYIAVTKSYLKNLPRLRGMRVPTQWCSRKDAIRKIPAGCPVIEHHPHRINQNPVSAESFPLHRKPDVLQQAL